MCIRLSILATTNTQYTSLRYATLACCVTNQQPEGAQLKPQTMVYVLTGWRKLQGSNSCCVSAVVRMCGWQVCRCQRECSCSLVYRLRLCTQILLWEPESAECIQKTSWPTKKKEGAEWGVRERRSLWAHQLTSKDLSLICEELENSETKQ